MGSLSVKRAGNGHCAGKIRFGSRQLHGFGFIRKQRKAVFRKGAVCAVQRHVPGKPRGVDRREHPPGAQKHRHGELRIPQLQRPETRTVSRDFA